MVPNSKQVTAVIAGIAITGLIFKYAGDLPVVKDIREGFQGWF